MNEESHNPSIEPELEARIVALVLSEASDFEREELNRLIEQRPELAAFKSQMQLVHGLLQDVGTGEYAAPENDWKLPADRRSAVLAVIRGEAVVTPADDLSRRAGDVNPLIDHVDTAEIRGLTSPARLSLIADDGLSADVAVNKSTRTARWNLTKLTAVVCVAGFIGVMALQSFYSDERSGSEYFYAAARTDADAQKSSETSVPISAGRGWNGVESSASGTSRHVVTLSDGTSLSLGLEPGSADADVPLYVVDVGSRKSSETALSAIHDTLGAKATLPRPDYLSDNIQYSPETPKLKLPEGAAAEHQASSSPEADTPWLIAKNETTWMARSFRARDRNGNGLAEPQPTAPGFGNSVLSFPANAYGWADTSETAPAPSVRLRSDAADGEKWLHGEIKALAADDSALGGTEPGAPGGTEPGALQPRIVMENEEKPVSELSSDVAMDDVTSPASGSEQPQAEQQLRQLDEGRPELLKDRLASPDSAEKANGLYSGRHFILTDEFDQSSLGMPKDAKGVAAEKMDGIASFEDPLESTLDFNKDPSGEGTGNDTKELKPKAQPEQGHTGNGRNDATKTWERLPSESNHKQIELRRKSGELGREEPGLGFRYIAPARDNDDDSTSKKKLAAPTVAAPAGLIEKTAAEEAFSTFSLHVSDVSFKLAFAALARGEWPEAAKIRIEEFVNAFDYGDPLPSKGENVSCRVEQSIHPFVQQRNLLRISMRTAAAGRASNTPLRLTFLLDNSGSMERTDRQQTVRRAFALLAQQLTPIDQVTLISFARQPRLLADKVSGADAGQLVRLIDELPSEGGTNIEAALQLAYEKAREQQSSDGQNRIILLTDGAVNLGDADPESLSQMVTSMRTTGIAFDAAGISAEGLNDEVLEALTRKGDGRYYLLDSLESADDGFVRQIAGALRPSAKNVKVQVEFNPKRVGHYKLLGYEKHILKKEDFRNDAVDAAEMTAAEAGVAMYQFEPKADGEGDVGSVSVRFQDLSTGEMIENRWPIPYEADAPRPDQAAPSLRIATSAALLAAKLRGEPLGETVDLQTLSRLISGLPDQDRNHTRIQQLQLMIEQARQLSGK